MSPQLKKKSDEKEEPKSFIPFEKGQVVCDLKIVKIDLTSDRGIGFRQALRRDVVEVGVKGEKVLIPNAIVKDPRTGKVVWQDYVHQMSLEDFQRMVTLKKTAQANVE